MKGEKCVQKCKRRRRAIELCPKHLDRPSCSTGGMEYELNRKLNLFVAFKEAWLAVDATGQLSGKCSGKSASEIETLPGFSRDQV
jgi:hypothetical protein